MSVYFSTITEQKVDSKIRIYDSSDYGDAIPWDEAPSKYSHLS